MRNLKVIFALTVMASLCVVSTASAKKFTNGAPPAGSGAPHQVYNPADGNVSMTADPGITTWELKSTGGHFNCDNVNAEALDPFFGTCGAEKIFTTWPSGSNALDFGPVYFPAAGVNPFDDMEIDGSLVGGGGLDREDPAAPYMTVPEPTGVSLLGLGALGLMGLRRKRK